MSEKLIEWADAPTEDDLADAAKALTLVGVRDVTLDPEQVVYPVKDLLRFADKPALPKGNEGVAKWDRRINRGDEVPPVLLVRGDLLGKTTEARPLLIAEGYHRVSACYLRDERTLVAAHFLTVD